jgi:hypothetical protein
MMAKPPLAPKGPFGGSGSGDDGWIGDRSKSTQVRKFEEATDYLFFQGPAPKSAVQPDLPSFLSIENFADMKVDFRAIIFAGTGFASLAAVLYLLFTG